MQHNLCSLSQRTGSHSYTIFSLRLFFIYLLIYLKSKGHMATNMLKKSRGNKINTSQRWIRKMNWSKRKKGRWRVQGMTDEIGTVIVLYRLYDIFHFAAKLLRPFSQAQLTSLCVVYLVEIGLAQHNVVLERTSTAASRQCSWWR